jgi:Fe-S-cluster containining protein
MEDGPAYDCQHCGACCVDESGHAGYVRLSGQEEARLRRLSLAVVTEKGEPFLSTRPHRGKGGGSICSAFAGRVGRRCGCSVYSDRPLACRRFEAGSLCCRQARREAGLPV